MKILYNYLRNYWPLLVLALVTCLTGFADMSSILMCFTSVVTFEIAVALGFLMGPVFVLGSVLASVDTVTSWGARKPSRHAAQESSETLDWSKEGDH